jgi:cytochrome c oxidase subunit IV
MEEHSTQSRQLPGDPKEHHVVSYKFHFGIWASLILLTALTVLVSVMGVNLVAFSVITALVIASTKALVVVNYFMHLKYDGTMLKIFVVIVMVLFVAFTVITAFDYLTR